MEQPDLIELGPDLQPDCFTVEEAGEYRLSWGRGQASLRWAP
jgi:hypothetical protein